MRYGILKWEVIFGTDTQSGNHHDITEKLQGLQRRIIDEASESVYRNLVGNSDN